MVEALIGAVYMDGGFRVATRIIRQLFRSYFDEQKLQTKNPKNELQEYSQKRWGELPRYRLTRKTKDGFSIYVYVGKNSQGKGCRQEQEGSRKACCRGLAERDKATIVIVPVFLPHLGCRQKCIYCNQYHITGKSSQEDIRETIRKALDPVKVRAEVAIYGGNPFGLGTNGLARLFSLFANYREKITSMRISTEPIVPDAQMIDLLRDHNVRTVELGIPVFSDEKLRALGRHHTVKDLYDTHEALIRAGFTVGLQVMVGLPGETTQDIRSTVQHVLRLKPAFIRVYPLVVLRDTPLHAAFLEKSFSPLSLAEAVLRALFIYLHAEAHGIKVIKMGLTETEFLKGEIVAGP